MNCAEAEDLIQLYLDDELDARSTLGVQQHLEGCPSCAGTVETLLQQDQLLQRAARAETIDSSRVRAGILTALQQQHSLPTPSAAFSASSGIWQGVSQALLRWWRVPAWPRLAAAVALVLVITLAALRFGWVPGVNEAVYAAATADHAAHCAASGILEGDITNAAELNRTASAFAHVRAVPDLTAFGYGAPRGRVCRIGETEFLHIVYQRAAQPPLSLFLRLHSPSLIAAPLTAWQRDGYRAASLARNGVEVLVVSSLDEAQTTALVQAAAAQF